MIYLRLSVFQTSPINTANNTNKRLEKLISSSKNNHQMSLKYGRSMLRQFLTLPPPPFNLADIETDRPTTLQVHACIKNALKIDFRFNLKFIFIFLFEHELFDRISFIKIEVLMQKCIILAVTLSKITTLIIYKLILRVSVISLYSILFIYRCRWNKYC